MCKLKPQGRRHWKGERGMTVTLTDFAGQLVSNPALAVTTVLTLGVIFVNGWTDAPNAIATCISTRSLGPRVSIGMAAVFNSIGVLVMTLLNATVAQTVYNMVDFGGNAHNAWWLCAPRCCHCALGDGAWWFGIPPAKPCSDCRYFRCRHCPARGDWRHSFCRMDQGPLRADPFGGDGVLPGLADGKIH